MGKKGPVVHRNKESYRYTWMTYGWKQNMALMWKKLMKNVDIDEPTSFIDHVEMR